MYRNNFYSLTGSTIVDLCTPHVYDIIRDGCALGPTEKLLTAAGLARVR